MARYLDNIITRFKRQEAKGLNKYGQILEDNPRGVLEALEYLAEELTDGLMYVEEVIEKTKQKNDNSKKNIYLTWEIWKDAEQLEGKRFKLIGHLCPEDSSVGDIAIVTRYYEIYGLGSEKYSKIRIRNLTGYEEWELMPKRTEAAR